MTGLLGCTVVRRVAAFVGALLLLAVIGGGLALSHQLSTPFDPGAEPEEFEVRPGTSATAVGQELFAAELIRHPLLWSVWLRLHPGAPTLKAGRHVVSASFTLDEIHAALAGPPLPEDEAFTVLEGWRRADTDRALADQGWAPAGAYLAATATTAHTALPFASEGPTLEGYLFPETYKFVRRDFEVERLVERQLRTFVERFLDPHVDEIEASGRSLHALVTIASMLEREEPVPAVRPKVAGVLYNRLDAGQALGVDATSRYGLDAWNDRRAFLKQLRDASDPYNTRLRTGLPPTPIGAPGLPSLQAALRPESSPYWYYLHDAQQRIHFSRTAQEHEANRRRYNVW